MSKDDLLGGLSIDRGESASGTGRKSVLLFVTVLLLAAGIFAVWTLSGTDGAAQTAASAPPPPAQSAPVQAAPSAPVDPSRNRILDASGYVVAMRIATVSARSVGRIDEVLVEEGMRVEEGQVLARLDSVSQRIQLDMSRARLTRAQAVLRESENRLKEAGLALERARRLQADRLVSDEVLDNAAIRVDLSQAELERQQADVDIVRQEIRLQEQLIEDNIIRAPFAGVVVQKNAQPGEIISPSTGGGGFTRTGICTIVDMSSLEIEVDVSESYINRVFMGQGAEAILDAYPSLRIPAEVSAIVPTADRQRATIKVRVKFRELDPRILPDMGVKVGFFEI